MLDERTLSKEVRRGAMKIITLIDGRSQSRGYP